MYNTKPRTVADISKEQGKKSRRFQNKLSGEEWEIIKEVWNSARESVHGNLVTNSLQS